MSSSSSSNPTRQLLRHTLATLAYRAGKAVNNAPADFSTFRAREGVRTPGEILAHIGDLFDWALSIAQGKQAWKDSKPLEWEKEIERAFSAMKKFDELLASAEPLRAPLEKLFQGPVADALTHVGQIALLRSIRGEAIRPENFYVAEIIIGRVGAEQSAPKREF